MSPEDVIEMLAGEEERGSAMVELFLRDFFAAAALAGFVVEVDSIVPTPEEAADFAYRYADAMLARRKKQ